MTPSLNFPATKPCIQDVRPPAEMLGSASASVSVQNVNVARAEPPSCTSLSTVHELSPLQTQTQLQTSSVNNVLQEDTSQSMGRLIPDLLNYRMLVTPIDAAYTFSDDPLRVFRAIRFSVRYDGLTLSTEIVSAARSSVVHDSLHVKFSRERMGKELEGMLSGKNAKHDPALKLMTDLKLAGCIFCFPLDGTFVEGGKGDGIADMSNNSSNEIDYSSFGNDKDGPAHTCT